jgi:hypothetical protein
MSHSWQFSVNSAAKSLQDHQHNAPRSKGAQRSYQDLQKSLRSASFIKAKQPEQPNALWNCDMDKRMTKGFSFTSCGLKVRSIKHSKKLIKLKQKKKDEIRRQHMTKKHQQCWQISKSCAQTSPTVHITHGKYFSRIYGQPEMPTSCTGLTRHELSDSKEVEPA